MGSRGFGWQLLLFQHHEASMWLFRSVRFLLLFGFRKEWASIPHRGIRRVPRDWRGDDLFPFPIVGQVALPIDLRFLHCFLRDERLR